MSAFILFFASLINLAGITNGGFQKAADDSIRFKSMTDPALDSIVVAKVGNVTLTAKDYVLNYYMGPSFFFKAKNPRHALLDAMTDEALFGVAARDSLPCIVHFYKWENGEPHFAVGPPDTTVKREIAPISKAIYGDLITEQLYRKHIWDTVHVTQQQLDRALRESQRQVSFRWLFAKNEAEADSFENRIDSASFNAVYSDVDSTRGFQRSTDYFHLRITSPQIFEMMSFAKEGEVSDPVKGPDGYYIFDIDRIAHSPIMTESERTTMSHEITKEIRQHEADIASDRYVNDMLKSVYPIIKWNAFSLLSGSIATKYLPPDKFNGWHMARLLMSEAGPITADQARNMKSTPLIKYKGGTVTLGEFFRCYDLRSTDFDISIQSRDRFMASVESYVWRMLRDKLLVQRAEKEGFGDLPYVKQQMQRWDLKLSYLSLLQHMNSLMQVDSNDVEHFFKDNYEDYRYEQANKVTGDTTADFLSDYDSARRDYIEYLTRASLLHTKALIERYVKVQEYYFVVDRLVLLPPPKGNPVDAFFFKTGGTFPRKAYPTIDEIWGKIIP